jgi:hypothetical protein
VWEGAGGDPGPYPIWRRKSWLKMPILLKNTKTPESFIFLKERCFLTILNTSATHRVFLYVREWRKKIVQAISLYVMTRAKLEWNALELEEKYAVLV